MLSIADCCPNCAKNKTSSLGDAIDDEIAFLNKPGSVLSPHSELVLSTAINNQNAITTMLAYLNTGFVGETRARAARILGNIIREGSFAATAAILSLKTHSTEDPDPLVKRDAAIAYENTKNYLTGETGGELGLGQFTLPLIIGGAILLGFLIYNEI